MADDETEDNLPVHPHDAIDPREWLLTTPMGKDRMDDLKRLMPDRASYGEFLVPYASNGDYSDFTSQANYAHFKKEYSWLHEFNGGIGLDVDIVEDRFGRQEDKTDDFDMYLVNIPEDEWNQFVNDVELLHDYPSIDDDEASRLEMEAANTYWEDRHGGFRDFKEEARAKFCSSSFQHWVLEHLDKWDALSMCSDQGHYIESQGDGSVYMDVKRVLLDIDWAALEGAVEDGRQGVSITTLMRTYAQAKEQWWAADGGDLFFAACQRRATSDLPFASGLAALTDDRLRSVYDTIVLDENIKDQSLPYYCVVMPDAPEVGPPQQPYLVVTIGAHSNTDDAEQYVTEAADEAANLAHDSIVNFTGNFVPKEHPELPFGGNLPEVKESRQAFKRQTIYSDKWVPRAYKIDDEFNCLTNAERLAALNPKLRYVEGVTRFSSAKGKARKLGAHAWCVAPDGTIVDPYFKWMFPDRWADIEYREGPRAFERIGENIDPRDFIDQNPRSKLGDTVRAVCQKCGAKSLLLRNWPDSFETDDAGSSCRHCGAKVLYRDYWPIAGVKVDEADKKSINAKDFILRQTKPQCSLARKREIADWLWQRNWCDVGFAEPDRHAPFWEFWFDAADRHGELNWCEVAERATRNMRHVCDFFFDLDWQTALIRVGSADHDFVFRITDPLWDLEPIKEADNGGAPEKDILEAKPIPDPYDKDKLSQADLHDWIVSGGPDIGELLWGSETLYVIIPSDQHTLDKYVDGEHLGSTYATYIVVVPDPQERLKPTPNAFVIYEHSDHLEIRYGDLKDQLSAPQYGAELQKALIKRYREKIAEARQQGDEEQFRDAALLLMAVGGHEALRGYYRHLRPGQVYRFDVHYGMLLLQRGRIAAAANRFGVDRQQVSKVGYLYAVNDWSDLTEFFAHGNNSDYRRAAKEVFNGDNYHWFDHLEGDVTTAIDWLLPKHYVKIRELLTWATVQNNDLFDGADEIVLSPKLAAQLEDSEIYSMLKTPDDFDVDGRVKEIVEALEAAQRRAQETGYSDAFYLSYTKALEGVLGKSKFSQLGGKDKLVFLIPWRDVLDRLDKANEVSGEFDGTLDDLVAQYSEPAVPEDDPSPDWKEVKRWYQEEHLDEMLYELKPLNPKEQPESPGQLPLPLSESRQMLLEGYKYGCAMIHLPPKQAQFLLQWGQLNIPDDVLYAPPEDDTMGREDEMHTTLMFGVEASGVPKALRTLVADTAAFPVYMGSVSLFRQKDHDVVKLGVESPWLRALHYKIKTTVPCPGDKYPDYKAHVTLAYVKSGSCDNLVGQDPFGAEGSPGAEFVAYEVDYKGPGELDGERVKEKLPLNKTKLSQPEDVRESFEPVFESIKPKDFILQQPIAGYHVKFTLHGENKAMYFQTWGRIGYETPGEPLPLETAEKMVAWARERYGDGIMSYVHIVPVFEQYLEREVANAI